MLSTILVASFLPLIELPLRHSSQPFADFWREASSLLPPYEDSMVYFDLVRCEGRPEETVPPAQLLLACHLDLLQCRILLQ